MFTTYKEICELNCILTPRQLIILNIPNKSTLLIRDFLDRKLKPSDHGKEIGSTNYISQSSHYFIKTKSFKTEYFLPFLDSKTTTAIRPQVFKNFNLKDGDLIICKDANIGESVILDQNYPNFTISGALYKLPITKNKLYLFAFLKHHYFREQLNLLVPKGSTIRHAKTLFLDCKIPFPNQKNATDVIKYIELLVQAVINKEKEIRRKNQVIFNLIEKEILENQQSVDFKYKNPKFNELLSNSRIDSGYYCHDYKRKKFLISNYKYGAKSIDKWDFKIKRGQNLQVSQVGKSIYSNNFEKNFYTLIKPTNFSEFGTIEKSEYLGNSKELTLLRAGDIVFSAEGTVGKCVLFNDPEGNLVTNIHGIVLSRKDNNIEVSAFVSCFLRFLRYWDLLNYISVGGQGGSLAKNCWKDIIIPQFSESKQKEICLLYHSSYNNSTDYLSTLNLDNFLENDQKWNKQSGIIEIDKSIKKIKEYLNKTLDKIVNDEKIEINFTF